MKMKKLVIAAICAVGVFALSGCGDNVALTNEQNDIIAEYVAGALLMHSYDNEWKYTKLNSAQDAGYSTQKALKAELNAASSTGNAQTTAAGAVSGTTASGTATAASAATGAGTTATTTTAKSLSEALGLSGVTVSYKDVSIGDRYPTDAYAVCVPADSGCKVVAVEFTIKNNGASPITATTRSSAVTMKLKLGSGSYNQYKSMLKNDICGLDGVSIAAGESYTAVAVFQVPSDSAVKSSDMKLEVFSGSQTVENISLQ